ncbi:MAG TPA: 2,3-bisphosphoglycerate-independent phosphoglycerate mutase [Thermoanaerobaculia bacterium]|nr:2,3-bisphosphoglycerate-independent phosphoglycerate mutase [Thermoanaerobaculia bacterium]
MIDLDRLSQLAQPSPQRIVLLVVDGVGDVRTAAQPRTPLEAAHIPHLDALAARGSLGRLLPVSPGITPGSGPGHLALFGYDPLAPEADIGRGVLEALGAGLEVRAADVAARGNFATADAAGNLTDRRAGRIPTSECVRLVEGLRGAVPDLGGIEVVLEPGEGHRFVLLLRGGGASPRVADTDPQRLGVPPLPARATDSEGEATAAKVRALVTAFEAALAAEERANRVLLRGFSTLPHLRSLPELYGLRCGAFAGYPLYRGVAAACGMQVVPCGKRVGDVFDAAAEHWERFDFFFLHVKQADQAGEDGDFAAKAAVLEEVDAALPRLLDLGPEVLAVTADHSTPVPLAAHSWHPVPLLLTAPLAYVDPCDRFDETCAVTGHLGTLPAPALMPLLLAHAGRLQKFGA